MEDLKRRVIRFKLHFKKIILSPVGRRIISINISEEPMGTIQVRYDGGLD